MNRKLALVGSVSAAVVLVSGAVMVGTLLISFPGKHVTPDLASAPAGADSTTAGPQDPVVVYQDDYEYVANSDPAGRAAGRSARRGVGDRWWRRRRRRRSARGLSGHDRRRIRHGPARRPGDDAAYDRRSRDHHDPAAGRPEGLAGRQADPADAAELP